MIRHTFTSGEPSDGTAAHVQGSDWNDDHVIDDVPALRAALGLSSIGASVGALGSGYDGALVMDGVAIVPGCALAAGVYTATREIFPLSLTINAGVIFKPSGYPVRVKGPLIIDGTISSSGNSSTGSAAAAVTWSSALLPGGAGSFAGGSSNAGGQNGQASNNAPQCASIAVVAGGVAPAYTLPGNVGNAGGLLQGGGGGSGGGDNNAGFQHPGGVGGNGGAVSLAAATGGDPRGSFQLTTTGRNLGLSMFTLNSSGGSGGGGGASGAGQGGGGGGCGGWLVVLAASFSGSGMIESRGGNGGNGLAGSGQAGGGGGPGGVVVIAFSSGAAPNTDVTGGLGGSGAASAGGGFAGASGGSGGSGVVLVF